MNKLIPATLVALAAAGFLVFLSIEGIASVGDKKVEAKKEAKKKGLVKLPPYKLVAPMDVLMDITDTMFYDLEEKIEEKKFKTVRKEALFLAEIANVTRYGYPRKSKRQKEWIDYCVKSVDGLLKMGAASKAKKEKEVMRLWKDVEKLCNGCHDDFEDDYEH